MTQEFILQATYFNLLISQVDCSYSAQDKMPPQPFHSSEKIFKQCIAASGIEPLALKVDTLASELSLIKGLLQSLWCHQDYEFSHHPKVMARAMAALLFPMLLAKDVLSIAALENFYTDAPKGSGATGEDAPPSR